MAFRIGPMTAEEVDMIQRLAHSRTEPARLVERARIIWLARQGPQVPAIARKLRLCQATVQTWLKRFTRQGLVGLQERARPGRPATYTAPPVPEATVAAVQAAFPKGNLYVKFRAEFGRLYDDQFFADLYPPEGLPVEVAPWRLALVMVMQYMGLARTHLQQLLTATAMNVVRVIAWLWGEPLGERWRKPGHLAQLAPHPLSRQTVLC